MNPLLLKKKWSIEEEWVLFLLQETTPSMWADFREQLVGRSDNSIKNYWNTTLRHKGPMLRAALNAYLHKRTNGLSNAARLQKKATLTQALLSLYISKTRRQYFEYINAKIDSFKRQIDVRPLDEAPNFLLELTEVSITLQGRGEHSTVFANIGRNKNNVLPDSKLATKKEKKESSF